MNVESIKKLGIYPGALPILAGVLPNTVNLGSQEVVSDEEAILKANSEKFLVNVTGHFQSGLFSKGNEVLTLASEVPTGSMSSGNKNEFSFDDSSLYICVQENHWKKINLVDF